MAFYAELRGSPLASRAGSEPYIVQGSVSYESAVGERPVGRVRVRVPAGATNPDPRDFNEFTLDYPAKAYRAAALALSPLHYWTLDEGPSTLAIDLGSGGVDLSYPSSDIDWRAFVQDAAGVPYGAAPEWSQTAGDGLSGALGAVAAEFTVAGFLRLDAGATGTREVWRSAAGTRRLRLASDGTLTLRLDGQTVASAGGAVSVDTWHHVAVTRTGSRLALFVDGVEAAEDTSTGSATGIGSRLWQMARPVSGAAVDLGLDEWAIFDEALSDAQVADLAGRARHHRVFGGYVFGVTDITDPGPRDQHVYDLSLAGYGLRLDTTFVRQLYASATGSSVREIAADVLSVAGLDGVFNSHGVTLNDIVDRAVYPVLGVMDILRQLADDHGAIVTVDAWREIDMVRETALTHSPLVLHRTAKSGNLRSLGRTTEPRHYANRSIVVGRGETGTIQDVRTTDGATRQWDLSQVPEEVLEVTLNGVNEAFEGTGALWAIDQDAARLTRAAGESTPARALDDNLKIAYVAREAIVITTDDAAAITAIGFTVARKLEDDAIDTPGLARVRGGAFLDRHNELSEHYVAETIPGEIKHIVAGVAPTCVFPRYGVNGRLLVEAVSSRLGRSGNVFHAVEHNIKLTAQSYPGDAGDDWRQFQLTRPPAPRPTVPGTVDPNQEIIRPDNVAVPASLPLHLGGSPALIITSPTWAIPDGAVIERVSGHQIAIPLALQFMGRCSPTGTLPSGQTLEVRVWDNTTGVPIGSAVVVDETVIDRYIERAIILPLREFDVTWQARVNGGLRGGQAWGVRLKLDI